MKSVLLRIINKCHFCRELPEPILTTELNLQFEESINKGISKYSQLISKLPPCNYAIVSWIIHHLHQVAANEKVRIATFDNSASYKLVIIVLLLSTGKPLDQSNDRTVARAGI